MSKHRGATLLEFVAAIAIFGILVVGMQSSVLVAVKSLPRSDSPIVLQSRAHQVLTNLSTELETALYVSELTATSIGFTVSDRNADGRPERLRYSWNGTIGAPITRQLNGGPTETVLASAHTFSVNGQVKNEVITYPAVCVEDAHESLLIDQSNVTQLLEHDVSSSLSLAQRFTLDLPTNSFAWRPTRIQFLAKYAALLGISTVQVRADTLTCAPGADVLQQQYLTWASLGNNYTWQTFNFADVEPLPSGGGFSLVLQRYFGSRAATLPSTVSGTGLLKGNGSGNTWELLDNRGLACQVYGKHWRASGTRSQTLKKYVSISVTLQPTSISPAIPLTVALLNRPKALSNLWDLDFTSNPTLIDSNGDGQLDWSLSRSGELQATSLTSSGWQTGGDQLVSTQDWNFAGATLVEFTAQCESTSSEGAIISFNALRSGSRCAPLTVKIQKQSDGTQSVILLTRTSDSQLVTLLNLTRQRNVPLNVRLIIDPTISGISVYVGSVAYGTYSLSPYTSSQSSRRITLGAAGSPALFQRVQVQCL